MTNIFSAANAKKAVLTTAMAATAITGSLTAPPAMARGHGGPGIGIVAGILGLIGIAAIASASDNHPQQAYAEPGYPAPGYNNGYAPAYAGPACFEAYPGYTGYCYPTAYYTNLGWAYRGGSWYDAGGHRYARPYYNRGGYAGYGQHMNNGGQHYNNGGQRDGDRR